MLGSSRKLMSVFEKCIARFSSTPLLPVNKGICINSDRKNGNMTMTLLSMRIDLNPKCQFLTRLFFNKCVWRDDDPCSWRYKYKSIEITLGWQVFSDREAIILILAQNY